MKALSLLKVKTAGDGHPRAPRRHRRWHRRRSPEADELQDKDVTAASSSASSSAKIAPAQPHEATAELWQQGGAKHGHCDKCCSPLEDDVEEAAAGTADVAGDEEWAAESEPGVLMTLWSRGDGSNLWQNRPNYFSLSAVTYLNRNNP
ncbi:hypothetical protein ACJX0J_024886, partial [Zea mays]